MLREALTSTVGKILPKMPCQSICNRGLTRMHLGCTTCWIRRYYYGKISPEDYPKVTNFFFMGSRPDGGPIVLPRRYTLYFIVINQTPPKTPFEYAIRGNFFRILAKKLFSIAEWLYQW